MKLIKNFSHVSIMVLASVLAAGASSEAADTPMFTAKQMADALHTIMESDRTVYTRTVVNRLTQKDKVIKASEHFEDDKALPLPAQMLRFGAEMAAEKSDLFSYALLSLWPVNKQNAARTEIEKQGLQYVIDNPDQAFYGQEDLGETTYFTAVYADKAVAPACIACHNDHKDSPKRDFKLGDVMGGVVVRIPLAGG